MSIAYRSGHFVKGTKKFFVRCPKSGGRIEYRGVNWMPGYWKIMFADMAPDGIVWDTPIGPVVPPNGPALGIARG